MYSGMMLAPWKSPPSSLKFIPTPTRPVLSASHQPSLRDRRWPEGLPKASRPRCPGGRFHSENVGKNGTCEDLWTPPPNQKWKFRDHLNQQTTHQWWIPTPSIPKHSPTCCFNLKFSPKNPKIIHHPGSSVGGSLIELEMGWIC